MENKYNVLLRQGKELCYLISVGLNNRQFDKERITDIASLFYLCQMHKVSALVGSVMIEHLPEDEKVPWKRAMKIAAMFAVRFDYERQEILKYLEQNQIWYMLMKGLVLRDLYPLPYYREMCDNDILYDASGYKILNKFMLARGYTIEFDSEAGHVDEYRKFPYYNFEMHKRFFMANHDLWCQYYSDLQSFLIQVTEYEYKMSNEDFYIYIILHTYKHYEQKGTGVRSLIDCYLYNQKFYRDLDWNYIRKELEKLGILEFENAIWKLSKKLFDEDDIKLTHSEEKMFVYILSSGAYGRDANLIEKKLANQSKVLYYFRRIVPDLQWFKGNVPFCYKHRWAIPFYCIYRFIDRGIRHNKSIKEEIKIVQQNSK